MAVQQWCGHWGTEGVCEGRVACHTWSLMKSGSCMACESRFRKVTYSRRPPLKCSFSHSASSASAARGATPLPLLLLLLAAAAAAASGAAAPLLLLAPLLLEGERDDEEGCSALNQIVAWLFRNASSCSRLRIVSGSIVTLYRSIQL